MHERLCIILASASLLAACAAGPERTRPAAPYPASVITTTRTPPPPLGDPIPASRGPQYAWHTGYWRWEGDEFRWIPGRYELRREGERWVAPRWVQGQGGWEFYEGHWQPE